MPKMEQGRMAKGLKKERKKTVKVFGNKGFCRAHELFQPLVFVGKEESQEAHIFVASEAKK